MTTQTVQLLDQGRNLIATAVVEDRGGYFSGSVNLERMPADVRRKFEEYEDLVNGQVLGLLDSLEDDIAAAPIVALFRDGRGAMVEDLQIFPQAKTVSYRLTRRSTQLTGLTA